MGLVGIRTLYRSFGKPSPRLRRTRYILHFEPSCGPYHTPDSPTSVLWYHATEILEGLD